MNKVILSICLACVFAMSVQAQRGFHRAYKSASPDSINFVTDAIATPSGEYQILAQDKLSDPGYSVNLMRLGVKGDNLYTRRIFLADSTRVRTTQEIIRLDNGVGVMSAILDDEDKAGALVAFDEKNGVPVWSRRFGKSSELFIKLANANSGNFVMATSSGDFDVEYSVTMLDAAGEIIWTNTFQETESDRAFVTDVAYSAVDSSIYLTGIVENFSRYFISKMDTLGNQIWSQSYNVPQSTFYPYGLAMTQDSLLFLTGTYASAGSNNTAQAIIRHDYEGNVDWAKASTGTLAISDGIVLKDNRIITAMRRYVDFADQNADNHPAIVEIDTAGNVIKSQLFTNSKVSATPLPPTSALMLNQMNGVAYITSEVLDNVAPTIISTDADLEVPCGSGFEINYTDISIPTVDLTFTKTEGITLDTMETDLSGLDIIFPTVSPEVEEWCPNEPILDTLDATPSNVSPDAVISYEWSTGATDSLIVAMEEGEFMVTVTIDDEHCYQLCDTVQITRLPLPQVQLLVQGDYCEDGELQLIAQSIAVGSLKESQWENGNEDPTRVVNTPGTYTYTIKDNCDETVSASYELKTEENMLTWPKVFFPNGQEELNKTFGPLNPCNLDIRNYELKVFNRWGQEVFTSDNINFEWDGRYNDAEGGTAVYVWYATYSIGDASPVTDKGDVTLIRG